jgi:hypothetical protein
VGVEQAAVVVAAVAAARRSQLGVPPEALASQSDFT